MARRRSSGNEAVSKRVQTAFGERLQLRRKGASTGRRNQEALADALGITRTSVSNIERGRHRVFLDQVYMAARELGVPLTELLPTIEEIYSDKSVALAANSDVNEGSRLKISEIAQTIQERAQLAHDSRPTRKRR